MSTQKPNNSTPTTNAVEPKRIVVKLPAINKTMVKVASASFTAGAAVATLIMKMNASRDHDFEDAIDEALETAAAGTDD